MTVGEAIDLVLIRVTGGHLTQDSNVQRPEIRAYLPVVLAYFLSERQRRNIKDAKMGGFPDFGIDRTFTCPIELSPAYDDASGRWYIQLPGAVIQVGAWPSVQSVQPTKNDLDPFVFVHSPAMLIGMPLGQMTYYYPECGPDGTKLYLVNYDPIPDCPLRVYATLDPSHLSDDDPLPGPSDIHAPMLDKMVEFFSGQHSTPADNAKDDQYINQKA